MRNTEEIEEWRVIEDYPDYMISNLGRVKSLKYGKERILKSNKDKDNYLRVPLHKEGKLKVHQIHRLVALHFIPNPNNLPQVNHKDEDPSNNVISNLEWCDAKYNINYGTRNEKVSKALKGLKHTQEHKDKISKANKGKIFSQELRDKLSKAHKGKILSQETKDKLSKAHKGKIFSQEHKDNLSKARKGRKQPQEQIEKRVKAISKPILQLTKEGDFIRQWMSAKQVERELNIDSSSITACCKGRLNTAGNFKWNYLQKN